MMLSDFIIIDNHDIASWRYIHLFIIQKLVESAGAYIIVS